MSFKKAFFNRRMLICLFNGASSGLPLFYIYHLIPAWLRSENVDLKTIGLFALVGIPYNWKFLWSPLFDFYRLPFLGLRRGWMLVSQLACLIFIWSMAFLDPTQSVLSIACSAFALAFFSASQDTVLDAYRTELLTERELGLGNALYMNGYRVMIFVPGGLGLILADQMSWSKVHFIIGCFMFIGIGKTLLIKELNKKETTLPKSIRDSVIMPLKEFFSRSGVKNGLAIFAFLFFYKLGDNMATSLSTPFYLDIGFSKTVIGTTVKFVNFISMIFGSLVGGFAIYRYGINKCLWIFGLVQMLSIFGFAILNESGPVLWILASVIAFEYLGVGLGASALLAFMGRATHTSFTASQFALFSSLISIPRTFANSICGVIIEGIGPGDGLLYNTFGSLQGLGYTNFFIFCGFMALPGMFLLYWVAPWKDD